MLRIDPRALRQGSASTEAEVPPRDPAFDGLQVDLQGPVAVQGVLQSTGRGTYYWSGEVAGRVRGECRRCLAKVVTEFRAPVRAVFSTDPGAADDPGVYLLREPVGSIDLSEMVREEVGLAAPPFPLCRENCAGLCPRCGADLNQGPCRCATAPPAS